MSTSSLTAKYRPQTFEQVAGQEAIKTILSRAAAQDKVAPAYLFSGTRGVGKTTIARIFAKALNCKNAPTAEPCNECDSCRQITAGVAVDVIEIDGASNRGIDDARRLKEDIGYAPLEGRYKVFIIDEAHMLTKEAFNALLKTLEEPPPRATFIMATTEPHKFPATIISRCQHYTYKMLSEGELVAHLENILSQEGIEYEAGALQIIAKRGAGSVRDSMSLLGQALAFDEGKLREEDVRSFLGLAGQEVFFQLMGAIHAKDLVGVGQLLRQVLDLGLDLGFFLRELTSCWRNMFLLRQAGEQALPLLGLSGDEAGTWMEWANKFDPAYIHACWQMTLDGQKRVMTSLEPAMALELLLLNIASLTDLINLEKVGNTQAAPPRGPMGGRGSAPGGMPRPPQGGYQPPPQGGQQFRQQAQGYQPAPPQQQSVPPRQNQPPQQSVQPSVTQQLRPQTPPAGEPAPSDPKEAEPSKNIADPVTQAVPRAVCELPAPPNGPKSWEGLLDYAKTCNGKSDVNAHNLRHLKGELQGKELVITCGNNFLYKQMSASSAVNALERLAGLYWGRNLSVRVETGGMSVRKSEKQLRTEAESNEAVLKVMDAFSALIMAVTPRNGH
ncbi:DNA polymerase III subunit gamma/tau [Salidesulfovibrio onnuriiensis]|uniref:DNA polymerase III subunit gamma/tau n=1 Tax=Salidesulfovibrio onnuriiensis TaxID=2583823 RepID=UPI0011C7DBDF|nr:DNA polymerase III subunit gamma/tau [Salidesulfovibrio onnuriiensis]